MPRCRCSNCDPEGSTRLFNYLQYLKEENFDEAVSCGVPSSVTVPPAVILKCRSNQGRKGNDTNLLSHHATPCPPSDPLRNNDSLKELTLNLLTVFQRLFSDHFSLHSDLEVSDLCNEGHLWLICKNHDRLLGTLSLDSIFGSEPLKGTYKVLKDCISQWKHSGAYSRYLEAMKLAERSADTDRMKSQAFAVAKEAKKVAMARKQDLDLLERENRELVRIEKRETKKHMVEEAKARKVAWWAGEAVVLAEFKRQRKMESISVSQVLYHFIIFLVFNVAQHQALTFRF